MNIDIQTLMILGIIFLSIIITIRSVFKNNDLDEVMDPILSGISTIITFFIVIMCYEKLDTQINIVLNNFFAESIANNGIVHIVMLGIAFILIKLIIEFLLNIFNNFTFKNSILRRRNKGALALFSLIFGLIRGCILVVLIFMSLSIYNSLASPNKKVIAFTDNKIYTKVADIVDKSQIVAMSNGIQEKVASNKLVYYNGITIDEGVKSNEAIDKKAREITNGEKSDKGKAKTIYTWIGSNIVYDDEKAQRILDEGQEAESGAIAAFNTKKGICLDYACLYTAMAKAVGLKTRVIVGEAYNGQEYVSHAWNEVYIPKEDRWISADSTFYIAGDYFDSSKFETQYKQTGIAGEF